MKKRLEVQWMDELFKNDNCVEKWQWTYSLMVEVVAFAGSWDSVRRINKIVSDSCDTSSCIHCGHWRYVWRVYIEYKGIELLIFLSALFRSVDNFVLCGLGMLKVCLSVYFNLGRITLIVNTVDSETKWICLEWN